MNLLQLSVKEVTAWPEGAEWLVQDERSGLILFDADHGGLPKYANFIASIIAGDAADATVERAQWEAERARIAMDCISAFSQEQDQAEQAVSQYEQELWDRVAASSLSGVIAAYTDDDVKNNIAHCFEYADAFMAERAKRLKR